MSMRTVYELREWLQARGSDGELLIQNDWWVWTNASGDICVQHPKRPDMSADFCGDIDGFTGRRGSRLPQEVRHDIK